MMIFISSFIHSNVLSVLLVSPSLEHFPFLLLGRRILIGVITVNAILLPVWTRGENPEHFI